MVTKTTDQNTVVVNAIASAVGNLTSMAFIRSAVTPVFDSLAKQQDNKPYFITRVERLMDSSISCAKKAVISKPYVIPTQHKFKIIETLVNNGAAASLINNSSASNDSAFVPADFEEYRPILMKMGVNLYEFRDDAYIKDHLYHVDTYYHNRTFIFDDKISYIGSSIFDPRSVFLNIEFGIVIESEAFAKILNTYLLVHTRVQLLACHSTV